MDERKTSSHILLPTRRHLQGTKLRHVVETGHRQPADVVVVESAEKMTYQHIKLSLTRRIHMKQLANNSIVCHVTSTTFNSAGV